MQPLGRLDNYSVDLPAKVFFPVIPYIYAKRHFAAISKTNDGWDKLDKQS